MATGDVTPEKAAELARAELEPGVAAVKRLAEVRLRLGEVLQEDAEVWREVSKFWSPAQLKRWGFDPPLRPGPGRPKRVVRPRVERMGAGELVAEAAALRERESAGGGGE